MSQLKMSHFLDWPRAYPVRLPDETLYSWSARFHRLSGNRLAAETSQMLYGNRMSGCAHDFPGGLDALVERTGGALGSAEELLQRATVLPQLLAFQTPLLCESAAAQLRVSGQASLKYRLGMLTSIFGAEVPLKACPICMSKDKERHQIAYWHRTHQLLGVWICPTHHVPLLMALQKSNHVRRFHFLLPRDCDLSQPLTGEGSPVCFTPYPVHMEMAAIAKQLTLQPLEEPIDPILIARGYAACAIDAGFVNRRGGLKLAAANADFLNHCQKLREIPEFARLPSTESSAQDYLRRLLTGSRILRHPLHHMVISSWLQTTPADALRRCDQGQALEGDTQNLPSSKPIKTPGPEIIARVMSGAMSSNEAANQTGLAIATIQHYVSKAGGINRRRPKVLTQQRLDEIVLELRNGEAKQAVADRHQVSVSTVTRVMRTEAGVQADWHRARFERVQSRSRRCWLDLQADNPTLSRKGLRLIDGATYAWLYRNDRAWLCEHQPPETGCPPHFTVDWAARDERLRQCVMETALQFTRRVTPQMLYQHIPELRSLKSRLSQLPLTLRAIEEVAKARPRNQDLFSRLEPCNGSHTLARLIREK